MLWAILIALLGIVGLLAIVSLHLARISGLLAAQSGNLGTISGQLSRLDDIYHAIANHK